MPQCAAVGCTNRTDRRANNVPPDVSFHSFPLRNAKLLKRWLHNIGREKFTPSKWSKLCSAHFLSEFFKEDVYAKYNIQASASYSSERRKLEKGRSLKDGAVPTEFGHRQTAMPRASSTSHIEKRERQRQLSQILGYKRKKKEVTAETVIRGATLESEHIHVVDAQTPTSPNPAPVEVHESRPKRILGPHAYKRKKKEVTAETVIRGATLESEQIVDAQTPTSPNPGPVEVHESRPKRILGPHAYKRKKKEVTAETAIRGVTLESENQSNEDVSERKRKAGLCGDSGDGNLASSLGPGPPETGVKQMGSDATTPMTTCYKKMKFNIGPSRPTLSPAPRNSSGSVVWLKRTSEEHSQEIPRRQATGITVSAVVQFQNVKEKCNLDLSTSPQQSVCPPIKAEVWPDYPEVSRDVTASEVLNFGERWNENCAVTVETTSGASNEEEVLVGPFQSVLNSTCRTTTVESSAEYQREMNRFTKILPKPDHISAGTEKADEGHASENRPAFVQGAVSRERPSKSIQPQTEDQHRLEADLRTHSTNTVLLPEMVELEEQPEAAAAGNKSSSQEEASQGQTEERYERPILGLDDLLYAFGNDHSYSCAARWARLLVKAAKSIQGQKMLGVLLEIVDRLEGLLDNGTDDVFCSLEHLLSTVHQQRIQLHHLMGVVTKLEKENSTMKAEILQFSEFRERLAQEAGYGVLGQDEKFDERFSPNGTKKCARPDRKRLLKELSTVDLNIELIKHDPKLCRRYTGFPNYYLFSAVFSTLETEVKTKSYSPKEDIGNTGDTDETIFGKEETTKTKEHYTSPNQKDPSNAKETSRRSFSSSIFPTVLKEKSTLPTQTLQQSPDEAESSVQTENSFSVQTVTSLTSISKPSVPHQTDTGSLAQSDFDPVIYSHDKVLKKITSNVESEKSIVHSVGPSDKISTFRCLSLEEEFLAALIRIKTDFPLAHLALKFNVPVSGMDRLTTKWAHFLLSSLVDFQDVPEFGFTTQLRTLVKRFLLRSLRGHLKSQGSSPVKQLDSSNSAPPEELKEYTISANW